MSRGQSENASEEVESLVELGEEFRQAHLGIYAVLADDDREDDVEDEYGYLPDGY